MRIGDFLCFAGTNFCGYGGLVFLAKHYFLGFLESTQYPALIIFSFLLSTCNRNTFFQTINQYFIVYRFVYEWNRQVVIKQTQFLSTVLLCSEFKLEDIYSEVDFLGKNVCANFFFCGNLFLRIVEKITKSQKLEPVKNSCHTVSHGTTVAMGLHVANYFPKWWHYQIAIR